MPLQRIMESIDVVSVLATIAPMNRANRRAYTFMPGRLSDAVLPPSTGKACPVM